MELEALGRTDVLHLEDIMRMVENAASNESKDLGKKNDKSSKAAKSKSLTQTQELQQERHNSTGNEIDSTSLECVNEMKENSRTAAETPKASLNIHHSNDISPCQFSLPLNIYVSTWNMGNQEPPTSRQELQGWLPLDSSRFDVIAIGLQESAYAESDENCEGNATKPVHSVASPRLERMKTALHKFFPRSNASTEQQSNTTRMNSMKKKTPSKLHRETKADFKSFGPTGLSKTRKPSKAMIRPVHLTESASIRAFRHAAAMEGSRLLSDMSRSASRLLTMSKKLSMNTVSHPFLMLLRDYFDEEYRVAGNVDMGELNLIVWVHKRNQFFNVNKACRATGIGQHAERKGGVVLSLEVNRTSLCFVNCHLAAHEGQKYLEQRNRDCATILQHARVGNTSLTLDAQFDHVFWFGDLNYRVDLNYLNKPFSSQREGDIGSSTTTTAPPVTPYPRFHSTSHESQWEKVIQFIHEKDWETLNRCDELHKQVAQNKIFAKWTVPAPNFPPTFKRVKGASHGYIKQRIPSYCDRVLWKSLPRFAQDIQMLKYECCEAIATSDHKPVYAEFLVQPTPVVTLTHSPEEYSLLVLSDISATSMLSTNSNPLNSNYVRFYLDKQDALVRERDAMGKLHVPLTKTKAPSLRPRWKNDEIPSIRIRVKEKKDLQEFHLIMQLMEHKVTSGISFEKGHCILALADYMGVHSGRMFQSWLYHNGKPVGYLKGRLQVLQNDHAKYYTYLSHSFQDMPGCNSYCNLM